MANYQKYFEEENKRLTADVNELAAQKKQNDATAKAQYNQGVDTAAQTASGQYQQRIDEAPSVFREQYDANHINELVNRKRVQESMANMGLTDSGLSRSQQTALSVQRGNADAATRQQQQAYVTAAQQAIDQIMAEAAAQKQQYGASVDQATNNWIAEAMLSARKTAANNANARVIADQEAETARIQAQQEALAAQYKAQQEAMTKQNEQRLAYAQSMMKNMDYDEDQAWAAAGEIYPTGDTKTDTYNAAYNAAIKNGYDRTYAQVIATAAANGQDRIAAVEQIAKTEIAKAGIDTGKLTTFFGTGLFDWATTAAQDIKLSKNWNQSQWNDSIKKALNRATERLTESPLTETAKAYAAAAAVGKVYKAAVDTADDAGAHLIGKALSQYFSGDNLEIALKYAGLE